jgi:glycosyltransferase involved in cell wall biosynthesis
MTRVAVVTPWFGASLAGGAERQAREIAGRLGARGHHVEVFTTCCRSFADDWAENYHPPGARAEDGLIVRRFPTDSRDAAAFDRANARLLSVPHSELKIGVCPVGDDAARDFAAHNINSAALVSHLRAAREEFDAFLFLPYLYGTTLRGLEAAAPRALLQPCLHDEAYARLPAVAALFRRARRVLFNSEGERELALRLYGPGIHTRARVVGEGVEPAVTESSADTSDAGAHAAALPEALRGARFVLYLGRRDATKNTDLLVRAFQSFRQSAPDSRLKLVLAGPGADSFDAPAEGIHDLGFVAEPVKHALLAAAGALFQPSRNESFSRALMEAWGAGRPAAAHRECPATALAIEHSGGGWLAANEDEWASLFARVDAAASEELDELGARGRAYAALHADWERALDRYEEVFRELADGEEIVGAGLVSARLSAKARTTDPPDSTEGSDTPPLRASLRAGRGQAPPLQIHPARSLDSARPAAPRAVHQLLPDFVFGDAISAQAVAVRAELRAAGYESDIFAKRREAQLAGEARLVDESEIEPGAALIYHHSTGSAVTRIAVEHRGPRCLVYHNVTPHEFYAAYRPGLAWLLETGRAGLPRLARHFPCSVGDSPFNAAELAACGFPDPGVLPIIVDPDGWNDEGDGALMRTLQDGRKNILFVGRVAPNKRQDALVRIFSEYLKLDPEARLTLAGYGQPADPYFRHLLALAEQFGLSERVTVTGRVDDRALLAYYRTAHLYLSPSEHEGFGVPLVEAMWFDVPVLARAGTAVTGTMADAGLLYDAGADAATVARLAHRLTRADPELRRRALAAQRRRREDFTPRAVRPSLFALLLRMEETGAAARAEVA